MKIIVAIHIITFLCTAANTQEKRSDDFSDEDDQFSEPSDKVAGVSSTLHATATPDAMHGFKSVVIHKEENISGGLTVQEPPKGWPFSEMTIQFPSNPKEVKVVKKQFKGDAEKILSSPGTIYSSSKQSDNNLRNLHGNTQTVNPFSQVRLHPSPTPISFVNYPYTNRTVGTNFVENTEAREPKSRQDFSSPSSVNLGYSIGFGSIPSALMPSTQMLQLINNLPTEALVFNDNNNAGNVLTTNNNDEEQLPQAAALRQEKPKLNVATTFSTPIHSSHVGVTGRFRNSNQVNKDQTKHSTQQQNWNTNIPSNHRFQTTSTNNVGVQNPSASTTIDTTHDHSAQNSNGLPNFHESFPVQSKPITFDAGHSWQQLGNGIEISNSASTQHNVVQENVQNNQNQAETKTQPIIQNLISQDHALFYANNLAQVNHDASHKSTQGSVFDHDNALGHSSLFSYNDAITGSPVALAQTQDAQNIANNILQAYTLNTKPVPLPTPPSTHTTNTNEVQTSQSQKQPVRHQFTDIFSINKQNNRNSLPTSQQSSGNNIGLSSLNGNLLQTAVNHNNNGGGLTANSHQLLNLNSLNHAIQSPIIMNPSLLNFGAAQPLHLGNTINSVQMPSLFIPLSGLQNIQGGQSLVFGTPIQGNANQIHAIPSQSTSIIAGTPHVMQFLPAKQTHVGATVIGHGLASAPVLPQTNNHQNYFNSVQADSGKQKLNQTPHIIKIEKFNSTPVNVQGISSPSFLQLHQGIQVTNNNGGQTHQGISSHGAQTHQGISSHGAQTHQGISSHGGQTHQGISSHGGQFLHNFNSNGLIQNGNVVGISGINQHTSNFNQGASLQAAHSIQGATALPLRSNSPIISQGTNTGQSSGNHINLSNPVINTQNHVVPATNFQGFVPINGINTQIPQLIQGNSILHSGQNNNVFTLNSANGIKSDFGSKFIALPGNLQKSTAGFTFVNKGASTNNGLTPGRSIPITYNGLNAQLLGGTFHFGRGLHLHKGNNKASAVKQQTQFSSSEQIQNIPSDPDILTAQSGNPFQNHQLLNSNIKIFKSTDNHSNNDNQQNHIVSGNANSLGTQTKTHTLQGVNDQLTPQQQHEIRLQHNTDKLRQQQALSGNVNGFSGSQVSDQTFASSNIQSSQIKNIPKSRSDKTRRNQDILRKPNISVTVHDLVKPVIENPENVKPVSYLNSAVPTYVLGLRPPSIHLPPMPLVTIA